MPRNHSFSDRLVAHLDNALKTLTPGAVQARQTQPGNDQPMPALEALQEQHIAGLMRINHTGEVCAQALYQGQALTAKRPHVRDSMEQAAVEELDHLAWCQQRLNELNSRTSYLNPVFYGLSYAMGAIAGLAGDKWSLGFVAATEDQVSAHLRDHLHQINQQDLRSTAILERMLADEERHAEHALTAGGREFPSGVKHAMTGISKVMTGAVYRV
jgi:ubiquinone biosynthesis monooxygenase Coq7